MADAILPILYQLSALDASGPLWGPFFYNETVTQNSALIQIGDGVVGDEFRIPDGYNLFLTHVQLVAQRGGAVNINSYNLVVENVNTGADLITLLGYSGPATAGPLDASFQPNVLMIAGVHRCLFSVGYSGASVLNLAQFSASGILVPKANVAQF